MQEKQKKQVGQRKCIALFGLLMSFFISSHFIYAAEGNLPAHPSSFVSDSANVLSLLEQQALEDELRALKEATGVEIAIVILESDEDLPIEEIALQIGRRWGVGGEGNRGIVVLLSLDDREARIEVGYGLEGEIPDIVAKAILEEVMIPHFKEEEFGRGILAGVEALKGRIVQDAKMPRFQDSEQGFQGSKDYFGILFFFLFFLLEWLLVILARTKSWWLGGIIGAAVGVGFWFLADRWWGVPLFAFLGLLLDYAVSKNYRKRGPTAWWAGGGWGPGGGFRGGRGGFGGFSGGSFGGGGATGRF